MRITTLALVAFVLLVSATAYSQNIEDDFEGNGNITTWLANEASLNRNLANPVAQGINQSPTVLEYVDNGGRYAQISFTAGRKLNIAAHHVFSFKIYVPSSSLTGNQQNVVTLVLRNANVVKDWESQTLITKPIVLNQWQVVTFNFKTDAYINADKNSPAPINRVDFDKIIIEVNGSNNTDKVKAYIDDFFHANNTPLPAPEEYPTLIWSDEFSNLGAADNTKWFAQTVLPEGNSWFNGEIQHYTDRLDNSFVANGRLKINAKKESYTNQGVTKQYTSARLNSKFAFKYGRVEARAMMPIGIGTWPAIWTLGKNITEKGAYWETQGFGTTPWPNCGEIDIVEHWGNEQNKVSSAFHTPSTRSGGQINNAAQIVPTTSTDFHIYAVEWTEDKLVFSIDGVIHFTYAPAIKNADTWPFDKEQYLIMNVAIQSNILASFSQSAMEVDYIRVYQKGPATGLPKQEINKQVKAFPNPVSDQIWLEFDNALRGNVSFKVYNMHGLLVLQQESEVENGTAHLTDLGNLGTGVYFITYAKDGLTGRVKFIK